MYEMFTNEIFFRNENAFAVYTYTNKVLNYIMVSKLLKLFWPYSKHITAVIEKVERLQAN